MAICEDKELYCDLHMQLTFVSNQLESDVSISHHCVKQALFKSECTDPQQLEIPSLVIPQVWKYPVLTNT